MPAWTTPPSLPPSSSPSPAVVTVRPLRYADLDGVDAGDEEMALYQVRDHAGDVTLDRSEINSVETSPVYLREHRGSPGNHEPVGVRRRVTVQTRYGGSATDIDLYDAADALDADHPPDRGGADRQRALAGQVDPGVYIEDADGAMTRPVTPDWGSQVYLSVLVPDLDPDTLFTAVLKTLDEQFPGHRLVEVQTRWAADRRVDVYRPALQPGGDEKLAGPPRTPLKSNVLESEAAAYGGTFRVEQVKPDAPAPTIGG